MARLPVAFVGHGSPMNAIEENTWSRGFRDLGSLLPRPRVVLAISAHWYVRGTAVTANEWPPTIHDFGGFPEPLYEVQYLARGDPALAKRVIGLLGCEAAGESQEWGLDHGTWSVLHHVWPKADVPVVQLSLDGRASAARHLEIGRSLAPLREEGVLILGSGNIVHNLGDAFARARAGEAATPDWAREFDAAVVRGLDAHDADALADLIESPEGHKAHPTPEHFLPLLYAAGAAGGDSASYPITGFDLGSISMRAVIFGGN